MQILLPRSPIENRAVDQERFSRTRAELVERFGGITAYLRSPAHGVWIASDGRREDDEVVMVEVMAPAFDRAWWRSYQDLLARRFEQEEVLIRALEVAVP